MTKKGIFGFFWPFVENGFKDFPDFLHECRDKSAHNLSQVFFSEKGHNHGL